MTLFVQFFQNISYHISNNFSDNFKRVYVVLRRLAVFKNTAFFDLHKWQFLPFCQVNFNTDMKSYKFKIQSATPLMVDGKKSSL